ncbi:MAG: 50S ribosomal protein L23 [Zetaproteobacteria bacterium]|nr:MAG: 50S ribosomal protein L23 [Zetaproteobacteria bacterium]
MSARYDDFQVLLRPVVTEKSYQAQAAANQYVFRVAPTATKLQIRRAVERIFGVRVERVQVANMPAKPKRRGMRMGRRSGYRKAVVRLVEGDTIKVMDEA